MVSDEKCWGFCCLSIFVLYVMIHVKMGFSFYCGPGYLAATILAARILEFEFVKVENSGNWDPFSFVLFFCVWCNAGIRES